MAVRLRVGRSSRFDPATLAALARGIASTRTDEVGCDRCISLIDQFVDLTLSGLPAAQGLPLVQDHLERCPDCREEWEALLSAVGHIS